MDIEFLKTIKRKENLKILRKEINENWVNKKILNHLERNPHLDYTLDEVKEEIKRSDLVASKFIKEPGRQNISENAVGEYISNLTLVENFINHPSNVSLFVVNGVITNHRRDGIKSIDYTWFTKGKKVFATQKYTNESGGSQDHQFNEVINFMENARGNKEAFFFAIVDGDYFTESKMETLKKYQTENVRVCRSLELEEELEKL